MKIALAMIVCTALYQECLPPHQMPATYTNTYNCMKAGYEESLRKLEEIGEEDVNKYNTYIKFLCYSIKEEPKEDA